MPDVAAKIKHGPLPELEHVNEPNMVVKDLRISPTREKKEYKGPNKAVQTLLYVNPLLTFAFSAQISALAGLADEHPGTAVTELANYAGAIHGFEPTQGTMVYEDPVRAFNDEDPANVNFNVIQYPFVITA